MARVKTLDAAKGKWRGILTTLGIDKSFLTGKHGPCPLCDGKDRFRYDDKDGQGTYFCSGCGSGTGMQLIQKKHGWEFREAAAEIDKIIHNVQAESVKEGMNEERRKELLRRLWTAGSQCQDGDAIAFYLKKRGLLCLWFAAASPLCTASKAPAHCGGGLHPTMVAMVSDVDGKPATLHRTFLGPNGKAPIDDPRATMPGSIPDGAAIRLTPVASTLGIAEGIETALAASSLFDMPVWAAVNATMLAKWQPPDGVTKVVVFGDNDAAFGGAAAAYALAHRLACKGKYEVEVRLPDQDEFSEYKASHEFLAEHGDDFRYDHQTGKWYQWDSTRWSELVVPVAFQKMREITHRGGKGKKASSKTAFIRGALDQVKNSEIVSCTASLWDQDPWLLGTPAGTLNLKTGAMHKPRRTEYITKLTGCIPENKPATRWLEFLDQSTDGDIAMQTYLQRIAGYCLTGSTSEHALFFIYGSGGNGKSVFLNMLIHILGDYARSAPMDTFTASKFDSHPTELAMLRGARLVTASETEEGRAWAEARIKMLTGGDVVSARFMRQDFFEYVPQFKLLFAGNHQPALHSVDPAMQRRFNMMPFVHRPKSPDKSLEDKLKDEAPRILAWALQGCLDWHKEGLARPASVIQATADYFSNQDLMGQWLQDCCETGQSYFEQPGSLFSSWSNYAKGSGESAGTAKAFGSALEKRGFPRAKVSGLRRHNGITLRDKGSEGSH
ncbi:hypothetical protein QYF36_021526 [Acer negundo]|nr:hypothetical protein QYF36_021526 [Acer negundo]